MLEEAQEEIGKEKKKKEDLNRFSFLLVPFSIACDRTRAVQKIHRD